MNKVVLVESHRGAMGKFPENTLSSIQYALDNEIPFIEVDILPIEDGTPVLYHDSFITGEICLDKDKNRIQEPIPITSLSLKQLKEFDCGSHMRKGFPKQKKIEGERISTLVEVFELLKNSLSLHAKKVILDLDFKWVSEYEQTQLRWNKLIDLSINAIKSYNLEDRVVIRSFFPELLEKFHEKNKNIKICYASMEVLTEKDIELAQQFNSKYLSLKHNHVDEELLEKVHSKGLKVFAWTVNLEKDWKRLIDIGVDIIATDYPVELTNFIKKMDN